MKIITVNVPEVYVKAFDKLAEAGIIPSRSEALRQCILLGFPLIFDRWQVATRIANAKSFQAVGMGKLYDENGNEIIRVPQEANKSEEFSLQESFIRFLRKLDINPNGHLTGAEVDH